MRLDVLHSKSIAAVLKQLYMFAITYNLVPLVMLGEEKVSGTFVDSREALEGRKIGNGEQSGSRGRIDWAFRLAGAVGAAFCGGFALLVMSLVALHLFPLGLIVFLAATAVGIVLGRLAGSFLFRRQPDR
jgi:hypothetical protein